MIGGPVHVCPACGKRRSGEHLHPRDTADRLVCRCCGRVFARHPDPVCAEDAPAGGERVRLYNDGDGVLDRCEIRVFPGRDSMRLLQLLERLVAAGWLAPTPDLGVDPAMRPDPAAPTVAESRLLLVSVVPDGLEIRAFDHDEYPRAHGEPADRLHVPWDAILAHAPPAPLGRREDGL